MEIKCVYWSLVLIGGQLRQIFPLYELLVSSPALIVCDIQCVYVRVYMYGVMIYDNLYTKT